MIDAVLRREVTSLFRAPFAWAVLAGLQFVLAWQFLAQIDVFDELQPRLARLTVAPGVTQLVVQPLLVTVAMLLLFIVPVLAMQSIAGERRAGTLALWYSAPVRLSTLVGGKFLALLCVLAVPWASAALMPFTLAWGTALDLGTLGAGLLGLALLMMATAAIGLFFSALTNQPALAALGGFACLMFLWMCDWSSRIDGEPTLFTHLSMMNHFQNFVRGYVDSADLAYFLLVTVAALALTVWRLDGDRRAL
ncbi:MAG: ABC transporter permease subunit [Gammaproteobacteria bacterium]|nr:ABC transporter permease subunit [Gammaproteobacteria bacterium]